MREHNILGSKRIKRNLITRKKTPGYVNTYATAASEGIRKEKWAEEKVDIR